MKIGVLSAESFANSALQLLDEREKLGHEMYGILLKDTEVEIDGFDVAASCDIQIAGVDFINSGGRTYLIEANWAPQWAGLMKATGFNIPKKIIEKLAERYSK